MSSPNKTDLSFTKILLSCCTWLRSLKKRFSCCCFFFFFFLFFCDTVWILEPFGMEDGTITNAQITVSSIHGPTFPAYRARLNSPSCWLPSGTELTASPTSWVNVDLLSIQNISAIVTQGCGYGTYAWWTTTLYVQYDLPGSGLVYVQDEQGNNKVTINMKSRPILGLIDTRKKSLICKRYVTTLHHFVEMCQITSTIMVTGEHVI